MSSEIGKTKRVSIDFIKVARHNPMGRLEKKKLKELELSIVKLGLAYPLLITSDGILIDGHRRLAAIKNLGWTEAMVTVMSAEMADELYADVNATAKKMTGEETLQVYLSNPNAVTATMRRKLQKMESHIGRKLMRQMVKNKAITTYRIATAVARYVGRDPEDFVTTVVKWILQHRTIYTARVYIRTMQSPKRLYTAIQRNRPINVSLKSK